MPEIKKTHTLRPSPGMSIRLMTAICVTRRVYASAGLWASGEFGMAGVPRAPDRRRLITLSSAD